MTVFLFAIFEMVTAGLHNECESDHLVTANIGIILAAINCKK